MSHTPYTNWVSNIEAGGTSLNVAREKKLLNPSIVMNLLIYPSTITYLIINQFIGVRFFINFIFAHVAKGKS